jgi:tRNA1Val (adenine37-N6)-methyltransferase
MLAQRNEDALVHAVEIDAAACTQAVKNMENSPFSNRLTSFPVSIQDYSFKQEKYDLIVSNPPFFSGGTLSNNSDRDAVRHTVKLPHGDLLVAVRSLLKPDGKFCVVLPRIEGLRFKEMAHRYHFFCTKITEVHSKKEKPVERLLLQFEKIEKPIEIDSLVIQKEKRNDWTQDYIDLTGAFYLKM